MTAIMLREIYEYYIYKISWFYKERFKTKEPYYYFYAVLCVFWAINNIILTLISFVLLAWNISLDRGWIRGISAVVIISGYLLMTSDNHYPELAEKYKDEKHSILKEWLVFLSLIGTFAIWCMMCWLLHR